MEMEYIIALTEHRHLGYVFTPYLIYRNGPFYSVGSLVKYQRQAEYDYNFTPAEAELARLIENYSDEKLAKKYARGKNVSEFFSQLTPEYFQKHIGPNIEKYLFACVKILIQGGIRLFKKDARYANLYDEDRIELNSGFAEAVFDFERNEKEIRYRLQIFQDNKPVNILFKNVKVIANNPCIFILNSRLYVFEGMEAKKLVPFFSKEFITVPHAAEQKYFETFILNAVRENKVRARGFQILDQEAERRAVLTIEPNLKYEPAFVLRFYYGGEHFLPGALRQVVVNLKKEGGSYTFYKLRRDLSWEKRIGEILAEAGLAEKNGQYLPRGAEILEASNLLYFILNWVNGNKPLLEKNGIEITQQNLGKAYFTGAQQLEMKVESQSDWFDVYTKVRFGEFEIPFYKLRKFILNGEREFELPNGEIAILPEEWLARYRGILPFAKHEGGFLRFNKYHFPILKNVLQAPGNDFIERIKSIEQPQRSGVVLPSKLKARLRPYQEEGFNWLFSLYRNHFGGCLADDMGLGKTLQTLALLLKLKRKDMPVLIPEENPANGQLTLFGSPVSAVAGEVQPASLIILPTSLVHNWENEIKKFAPSLKSFKYTGTQRKKGINLGASVNFYDIILTTYGTLRNDIKLFSESEFFYVILDESQYIKNPASKTYKAVSKLKAKHRLVLTGTPIENSLSDLWSQVNFLNRGMLGNLAFFRQNFITPIEKHNDPEVQEKLQAMIRPFILRRTKSQVANDLPPVMEQVVYCPMKPEQQEQYEEEKSVIRNSILERIDKEGIEKSSLLVLQGLAKLRQLSNHPQMLDKGSPHGSGKFEEIFRLLDNLLSEKHKVLIFSSFVKHLDLIKSRIESEGLKYSLLTGSTTNREEVISRFQDDSENRIFLISLKAGGVGLNLTSADYVFILDPWWNPASEIQAVSRAHRIGQEKHVFVYRFITEDSIEEKIQQLKIRKSALADKFVNSNNPFKEITKEEILNLFK